MLGLTQMSKLSDIPPRPDLERMGRSKYRVIERSDGTFVSQTRGFLWGWNDVDAHYSLACAKSQIDYLMCLESKITSKVVYER